MEVNSIDKIVNLISNLNFETFSPNYKIRKIDYCYELKTNHSIVQNFLFLLYLKLC